jgi:dual specificity MAP kinase phosphatase
MSTILEGKLFLGGLENGADLDFLERNNIKSVIRILDANIWAKKFEGFAYHTYYLYDDEFEDITGIVSQVYADYLESRARGGGVLIHCGAGLSRSVCVTAYILVKEKICRDLSDAFRYIQKKHSEIHPAPWFVDQILELLSSG